MYSPTTPISSYTQLRLRADFLEDVEWISHLLLLNVLLGLLAHFLGHLRCSPGLPRRGSVEVPFKVGLVREFLGVGRAVVLGIFKGVGIFVLMEDRRRLLVAHLLRLRLG